MMLMRMMVVVMVMMMMMVVRMMLMMGVFSSERRLGEQLQRNRGYIRGLLEQCGR